MDIDNLTITVLDCLEILRKGEALNVGRERLWEIGETINEAGGISDMQKVAATIRYMYPHGAGTEDGWHPGELDHAWDGIGEWIA